MYTITVASRKGGVCKTTVAVNLAAALALDGFRILVVDIDSQANASRILLDDDARAAPTMADAFVGGAAMPQVIRPGNRPGVDVAPASKDMVGAIMALVDKPGRETILKRLLRSVSGYDMVIMDTGPEAGLGTVNALVAASHVLIPFDPDAVALEGMETTVEAIGQLINAELSSATLLGALQVRLDKRLAVTQETRQQVAEAYQQYLFEATLRANAAFIQCAAWHKDIFQIEADRRDRRGSEDFNAIAAEVCRRLNIHSARDAA